jgi:putative flippase GtrA
MLRRQFQRYLIVGALGTGVHLAILALCVEWLCMGATGGTVAGFIGALLVSYILNHRWAFDSSRPHASSLWRYALVSVSGLVLNTTMVSAMVNYLQCWYFTAQLSVIWVVPISNFFLNRYWTFGTKTEYSSSVTHISE